MELKQKDSPPPPPTPLGDSQPPMLSGGKLPAPSDTTVPEVKNTQQQVLNSEQPPPQPEEPFQFWSVPKEEDDNEPSWFGFHDDD